MSIMNKRSVGWMSVWVLAALLAACSPYTKSSISSKDVEKTTVYLVRHAEKINDSRDPDLSDVGKLRATELARVLEDVNVDRLWSSDYKRTKQTLAPLSRQSGVPVTVYDAGNSRGLVSAIFEADAGKTHVIAGHSNTVPELVDVLESWPSASATKAPRAHLEHDEYTRLYVVTVVSGRKTVVEERRF